MVRMLEKAVDASFAEPLAGPFEGEDVGGVDDVVDHRRGDGLVPIPITWGGLRMRMLRPTGRVGVGQLRCWARLTL